MEKINSVPIRFLVLVLVGGTLLFICRGQKDPLVPKEGNITVSSEPSGASIYLDHLDQGMTTPDTLEGVPVGTHTIEVVFAGHQSCPDSLSVEVEESRVAQAHFFLLNPQHVVLGEEFTSTTCGPGFSAGLVLDTLAQLYSDAFVLIRYHVWWPSPGDDPFYHANVTENRARNDYYNNMFAPHLFLDGSVDAGDHITLWEDLLTERISRENRINLTVSNSTSGSRGTATAQIFSCSELSDVNLVVHFVITESEIGFDAPNGESSFHQVMRDMLPDASGERIAPVPDMKLQVSRDYSIHPSWNSDHLNIVVFIQDDDTREVLQAASIPLQ
jgi:hypothetical protein